MSVRTLSTNRSTSSARTAMMGRWQPANTGDRTRTPGTHKPPCGSSSCSCYNRPLVRPAIQHVRKGSLGTVVDLWLQPPAHHHATTTLAYATKRLAGPPNVGSTSRTRRSAPSPMRPSVLRDIAELRDVMSDKTPLLAQVPLLTRLLCMVDYPQTQSLHDEMFHRIGAGAHPHTCSP